MPLYSENYLRNLSEKRTFSETLNLINESKSYSKFDIFLSHSYLDRSVIRGLFIELTSMGYRVYVDWLIDPHLDRTNVTKESAELIRRRMKSSESLLLAISTNASTSKWMPWELGFVDGNTSKCAIIPVSDKLFPSESYQGFEYLKLYPFVKKHNTVQKIPKLWVIEDYNKYVIFDDYLNENRKPYFRDVNIF
ncbi:toll/interleukin-1 receptor domain-containing protein [Leeuwenhoekiella palythoae]|uniref:toll/interleukin-1 receptor domain-containing protein n=1 Tax=Leeuwenhoekiella palythoae TaxID=573501 RepID=UPI001CE20224|nr:toll/interleukin-1 receptor domain-containing protein [Leeuwenhoekiella palythoae]UBZ08957.1 toll/interleukin-1 receptor domain-containing protein [Leeuwenhoekiella palythoae]